MTISFTQSCGLSGGSGTSNEPFSDATDDRRNVDFASAEISLAARYSIGSPPAKYLPSVRDDFLLRDSICTEPGRDACLRTSVEVPDIYSREMSIIWPQKSFLIAQGDRNSRQPSTTAAAIGPSSSRARRRRRVPDRRYEICSLTLRTSQSVLLQLTGRTIPRVVGNMVSVPTSRPLDRRGEPRTFTHGVNVKGGTIMAHESAHIGQVKPQRLGSE